MLERDIQKLVQLEFSRLGSITWRNNVGLGWTGNVKKLSDSRVLIENARPLHAGLHRGSSDLIGLHSIVVTPEMVGRRIAVFLAGECKAASKKITEHQKIFLDCVRGAGGIAIVARSEADARGGIREWINSMKETP